MKPVVRSLLLLFSCFAGSAFAQIRDDESSRSVLAVQCAASSGFSASEYEDYSRRLAKTLALLTSTQQKRVFGYLPQPAMASSNEAASPPVAAGSDQGSTHTPQLETHVGDPGKPNDASTGTTESVGSSVSGIAKGDTAIDLEPAATAIASTKKGNTTWEAIVSWLSALAAKARNR